jgi:hypothetical protein
VRVHSGVASGYATTLGVTSIVLCETRHGFRRGATGRPAASAQSSSSPLLGTLTVATHGVPFPARSKIV